MNCGLWRRVRELLRSVPDRSVVCALLLGALLCGCSQEGQVSSNSEASKDIEQPQEQIFQRPTQPVFEAPHWGKNVIPAGTGKLQIVYPRNETLFPPEIIAPTFKWKDEGIQEGKKTGRRWAVRFSLSQTNTFSIAVGETWWRPEPELWTQMKLASIEKTLSIQLIAYDSSKPKIPLDQATVQIETSTDEVGAEIFYREVNLPFIKAAIDPSKIRWRSGNIAEEAMPKIVLENLPVCGNCHSFSRDSKLLAMDVDYANTKACYIVTPTAEEMSFSANDVIAWNDYKAEDGTLTFGLLSQISPDGQYVISTVKDSSVFVDMPGLDFSQLFFPIKGILVWYDRNEKTFHPLVGADDPKYVQSNPVWSPDGKEIVFARAEAYDLRFTKRQGRALLTREECREFTKEGKPFRYDLYRIPFSGDNGETPAAEIEARPLVGASGDGKSNFFPKYSPDGKWIVFCKADNYMLLQPDSSLYIIPAQEETASSVQDGVVAQSGNASVREARRLRANLGTMNSWHSWSPNSRWLVFSSKENGPYTQLWLTHIDENGESTPAVVLENFTEPDRAANIPEFYRVLPKGIQHIKPEFLNDDSLVRSGMVFYYNEEWDAALEHFKKALEINPRCFAALQRMGYIEFFIKGNQKEGIALSRQALELDPSYAFSQYDYGVEMLLTGDFAKARKHISKAIELIPGGFDSRYESVLMRISLSDACLFGGDLVTAQTVAEEALKFNSEHPLANYKMAFLLMLGNREADAITYMNKAIAAAPQVDTNPELHQYIGLWYAKEGQSEEARMEIERAIAIAAQQGNRGLENELRQLLENL